MVVLASQGLVRPPCLPLGQRHAHCLAAPRSTPLSQSCPWPSRDAQWTLPADPARGVPGWLWLHALRAVRTQPGLAV